MQLAPTPIKDIPEDVVFEALIESSGNTALAAERVCTKLSLPMSCTKDIRQAIPRLIADRLPDLKRHMEAVATLELFSMLPILNKTLVENLTQLDANEAVNAYMKLMDQIGRITDDKTLTLNVNDAAYRLIATKLPQEVMDHWLNEESDIVDAN